jgi:uncharacterized protein (DUF1800 family)
MFAVSAAPATPTTAPASAVPSTMPSAASAPADPLARYVPNDAAPWDVRRAGHLLRRASFGTTPARLEQAVKDGPGATIAKLLDYDPAVDPLNDMIERLEGFVNFNNIQSVQSWWVYRMINTDRPFQERLALFWHNRFATSAAKVENARTMHNQVELFRREGLGNWRDLLLAVGRDPAMLIWLDGRYSKKGKPNENYARELMELFTLGVGHYTEKDVQELARVFTGWRIEGEKGAFNPKEFDDGEKTFLGVTGKLTDEKALDVILAQPAAPRFLARNLLREFVHPNPPDDLVAALAARVLHHNWNLKPIFAELFNSRVFFSDWAYRAKIKSPCDLSIGVSMALGGTDNTQIVATTLGKLGQSLLFPPTVKGWDGEQSWINANTVLVRFNYGLQLATQRGGQEFVRRNDLEAYLKEHGLKSADAIVDHFARLLLDGRPPEGLRDTLIDYMNRDGDNKPKPLAVTGGTVNSKVRGMLHLLMATPVFQLC